MVTGLGPVQSVSLDIKALGSHGLGFSVLSEDLRPFERSQFALEVDCEGREGRGASSYSYKRLRMQMMSRLTW